MERSWIVLVIALSLMTPIGAVAAQPGGPGDQGPPEDRGNESADAAPDTNGTGDNETEENETSTDDRRGGPPAHAEERREQAKERAQAMRATARGMTPMFTEDNGTIEGRWVSFQADDGLPGITDYTVQGNLAMDSIALAGDGNVSSHMRGATYSMSDNASWLRVLGTPNALALIHAGDGGSATLTAADNVTIEDITPAPEDDESDTDDEPLETNQADENETEEPEGNQTAEANETQEPEGNSTAQANGTEEPEGNQTAEANETQEPEGNETAEANETAEPEAEEPEDAGERSVYRLTLADNSTMLLAGTNLSYDGDRTFTLDANNTAQLRLGSPATRGGAQGEDASDRGRGPPAAIDGRASRAQGLDAAARDRVQQAMAGGQIGVEVYADADSGPPVAVGLGHVNVTDAQASKNGSKRASLSIEAPDDAPGTTVSMTLDGEDLGNLTVAEAADQLGVRYDGRNISAADNLEDVLDWQDDDGEPEHLLLVGNGEVQILISVPHFSPHTVEVYQTQSSGEQEVEQEATPFPAALAALAVVAAAALLGRRKR